MLTLHNVDEKGKLLTLRARGLVYIYFSHERWKSLTLSALLHDVLLRSWTPSWKLNAPGGLCLRLTRLLAHHSMDSLYR